MTLTTSTTYPFQVRQNDSAFIALSGTFASATVTLAYATAGPATATLTVQDGTPADAMVLTAAEPGVLGNSRTFAVTVGDAPSAALTHTRTGWDVVISPATSAGDFATVTTAMTGADNDLTLTAKARGTLANSYSLELLAGSGATQALSIATADCKKFSVTLQRAGDAIVSTATEVAAALTAYAPFAALMTCVVKAGDSGAGVVTALNNTPLAGGGANFTVTTTYAELVDYINGNDDFRPHFSAALYSGYEGTEIVAALAETALAGGTAGTFVTYPESITQPTAFTAAGGVEARNIGVTNHMALVVTGATGSTSILATIS